MRVMFQVPSPLLPPPASSFFFFSCLFVFCFPKALFLCTSASNTLTNPCLLTHISAWRGRVGSAGSKSPGSEGLSTGLWREHWPLSPGARLLAARPRPPRLLRRGGVSDLWLAGSEWFLALAEALLLGGPLQGSQALGGSLWATELGPRPSLSEARARRARFTGWAPGAARCPVQARLTRSWSAFSLPRLLSSWPRFILGDQQRV